MLKELCFCSGIKKSEAPLKKEQILIGFVELLLFSMCYLLVLNLRRDPQ